MMYKSFASFEVKDNDSGIFQGYAATFAKDQEGDRFLPGAFAASIKEKKGKIPILLYHNRAAWAGVSSDLAEDAKGLYIEGKLFTDTATGKEAYGILRGAKAAGYPVGLSVGFIPLVEDWEKETSTRLIKETDLWETSITPFPANKRAGVETLKSAKYIEQILRDVGGCSIEKAKRCASLLAFSMPSGDPDGWPLEAVRDVRPVRQPIDAGLATAMQIMKEFKSCLTNK